MKLYTEGLINYKPWSGATDTWNAIVAFNKIDELENTLTEYYPDGMSTTQLNDLLWFEPETVCEWLGLYYNDGEISDEELEVEDIEE